MRLRVSVATPGLSVSLLEPKLCAESDRTVSKVVQILTKVSAVQTIYRNPVVVLIESIQEVGTQDELACLVELDVLRKTEIRIVKAGSSIGVPTERSVPQAKIQWQTITTARNKERRPGSRETSKVVSNRIEYDLSSRIEVGPITSGAVAV